MANSNSTNQLSFRFLSLDKLQAFTLQREIVGASYSKDPKNDRYLGSVPLTEANLEDINNFYVRQRIAFDDCDIFISTTSSRHKGIVEVPIIVNRFLKYIDCKLRFSFMLE